MDILLHECFEKPYGIFNNLASTRWNFQPVMPFLEINRHGDIQTAVFQLPAAVDLVAWKHRWVSVWEHCYHVLKIKQLPLNRLNLHRHRILSVKILYWTVVYVNTAT